MEADILIYVVAALAISEALAFIPRLKSNGVLHFITLILRRLASKKV